MKDNNGWTVMMLIALAIFSVTICVRVSENQFLQESNRRQITELQAKLTAQQAQIEKMRLSVIESAVADARKSRGKNE